MPGFVTAAARLGAALVVAATLSLGPSVAQTASPEAAPTTDRFDAPDRPLVVMNLAGHPDDEDGLTMAYYRGNQDAAVYSVIYTRGEGGQNEAGPDLYERLGAIRTAETEAAARILGTRVFYLNRYDFGFSKHAWETFGEWSRERRGFWDTAAAPEGADAARDALVADLVRLVRMLKPDVMFTNHDTSTAWPNAQHGHHQAVGISAVEAFRLAADPDYRPQQLREEGVDLWQPQRLFLRTRAFWSGGDAPYDAAVPVGDTCAATLTRPAEPCADRAVEAVAQHVSQGFDLWAPRFRRDTTYFTLLAEADGAPALPEAATDLAAGLAPNPHAASRALATLVDSGRLPALDGLTTTSEVVVPSQDVFVRWPAGDAGHTLTILPPRGAPVTRLGPPAPVTASMDRGGVRLVVPSGTTPSAPRHRAQYEQQGGGAPYLYEVRDADGALVAGGRLPLDIVPPATVDLAASPIRLEAGVNEIPIEVTVYDVLRDSVEVGLTVYRGDRAVAFEIQSVPSGTATFAVDLSDAAPGPYRIIADARTTGCGLPWYRVALPAAVLPDVAVAPGLRVGFVETYDGTMGRALETMGADVVRLDSTALASAAFDGLHTVVVDIRALLDRPDLVTHKDRLIDYVEGGGHLVVGYHKSFEWSDHDGLAPYPLTLGRSRVTMEDAPVEVLAPEHAVFQAPHVITEADWDGWVQERGLYFPSAYDDRYQELLSVGDLSEAPLRGGLLVAEAGAGTYVYSPLVWYRQLDALNPGAWRLFANLVSLPLTDGRAERTAR
ncbi:MAG: PIG-L family deacetylase [Bacteroidota bacterium]